MSGLVNTIFNIVVNLGAPGVTRQGFGTILIIGPNAAFSERIRFYESAAELLADVDAGIDDTDPEYLAAAVIEANGVRRFAVGKKLVGDADYGVALDAIVAESNDFYAIVCTSRTEADIDAIAAKLATHKKLFFAQTADADVITSATNDVASELKDASNARIVVCYHTTAAERFDAGIAAAFLRADPDRTSTTATAKQLSGVAIDKLTSTARGYALAKNVSIYEEVKGLGWTFPGKVAAGFWADEILIRDWYEARIGEDLAQLLADVSARDSKVPGNARGAAAVENVFRKRHSLGVGSGHFDDLRPDGTEYFAFTWSHNAATRTMTVSAREKLAGAVHEIDVTTNLETTE